MVGFHLEHEWQSVTVFDIVEGGVNFSLVTVEHLNSLGMQLLPVLSDEPDTVVFVCAPNELINSVCKVRIVDHMSVDHDTLHKF